MSEALAFMIFGACVVSFGSLIAAGLLRNLIPTAKAFQNNDWLCGSCGWILCPCPQRARPRPFQWLMTCTNRGCKNHGKLFELPEAAAVPLIPRGRIEDEV